ncbi:MAG: hypothetical protein ACJ72Q_08735 [Nitrososphaeraceae archaeon]
MPCNRCGRYETGIKLRAKNCSLISYTVKVNKKKAIPFIQELRNIETNEYVKNDMFDTITQIEKEIYRFCMSF